MSRVPMQSDGGGLSGANPELEQKFPMVPQGISADLIATLEGFDRQTVDAFALSSQRKCAQAVRESRFERRLIPVHAPDGTVASDTDEHPRPSTTADALASLKPAFAEWGAKGCDKMALSVYPQAK